MSVLSLSESMHRCLSVTGVDPGERDLLEVSVVVVVVDGAEMLWCFINVLLRERIVVVILVGNNMGED